MGQQLGMRMMRTMMMMTMTAKMRQQRRIRDSSKYKQRARVGVMKSEAIQEK